VVLSDAEHVEAEPVRELDLLEEALHALLRGDRATGRGVRRAFPEAIKTELDGQSGLLRRDQCAVAADKLPTVGME
jgi:hypothetical protein